MAVTESTPNPLANILTSDKYDIRPSDFTADAGGYVHGEIVTFNATTNTYAKCILNTDQADGVVYDSVDIDGVKGLVIKDGSSVRASSLIGYSALATVALKGQVVKQLLDKGIKVEDV